jgi:hypothetical protein
MHQPVLCGGTVLGDLLLLLAMAAASHHKQQQQQEVLQLDL